MGNTQHNSLHINGEPSLMEPLIENSEEINNKLSSKEIIRIVDLFCFNNGIPKEFIQLSPDHKLDFFESSSCIAFITRDTAKARELAKLLPKSDRPLLAKYYTVPLNIFKIMLPSLKCDIMVNGANILFELTSLSSITHRDVLDKILLILLGTNIDVNATMHGQTFFESMIVNSHVRYDTSICELMILLNKRNYDFNHLNKYGKSFFSSMVKQVNIDLSSILQLTNFNYLIDAEWIYQLTVDGKSTISYLTNLFKRADYPRFLLESYLNLPVNIWGDNYIKLLKRTKRQFYDEIIECLNYVDKDGNTVCHHMAIAHDKATLQYVLINFESTIKLDVNSDGKTVRELYKESKILF